MNHVGAYFTTKFSKWWHKTQFCCFACKIQLLSKKSATKFLCAKTSSGRVVAIYMYIVPLSNGPYDHVNKLLLSTTQNSMKIDYSKTKEMLLVPLVKLSVPGLDIDHNLIERVSGFKRIGVHISSNMSWNFPVDYRPICATANTRLHYLKR